MNSKRILIANRGEIALRIARAARELGHIPLAIYSREDRRSLHVSKADAAYCVGEGPSINSYLNIDSVIEAARILKADLIHPGYGFLSENPRFAERVAKEGFSFIGPPAKIISTMGDKVAARQTMEKVGLKLIPGTKEGMTDENLALTHANKIGYPLMIKALAGGGGRGMRLVQSEGEFLNLFKRALSEASKAFGDGTLYLEKYITAPHHIEVQIIADQHGNVCHLFERECSVQRRHQKVIEESPSPFLLPDTRAQICEASVRACKQLGYVNAGTIEYLVDENQNFYFMEMNTRLQVEHPVTEWVTGLDIVREQIQIALGQKLSFTQKDISVQGHAIEFRIYAEDPEKMLPQAGKLTGVDFPIGPGVRVDSHAYRGYSIPVLYDSMIAKISVWARNRKEALERSRAALLDTTLNGIRTNVPLHLQLIEVPQFIRGNYTTKMIEEHFKYEQVKPPKNQMEMAMIAAAVSAFQKEFCAIPVSEDDNSRWKAQSRFEGLR